jgi:hypothetical protein
MIVYVIYVNVKKIHIVMIAKVIMIKLMVVIRHHRQIDHVMKMEILRDINHERIMMMIVEIEDVQTIDLIVDDRHLLKIAGHHLHHQKSVGLPHRLLKVVDHPHHRRQNVDLHHHHLKAVDHPRHLRKNVDHLRHLRKNVDHLRHRLRNADHPHHHHLKVVDHRLHCRKNVDHPPHHHHLKVVDRRLHRRKNADHLPHHHQQKVADRRLHRRKNADHPPHYQQKVVDRRHLHQKIVDHVIHEVQNPDHGVMIKNHHQSHHPFRRRMLIKNLHDLFQKAVTVKMIVNVILVMTNLKQIQHQVGVIVVVHHRNLHNIVEVQ